MANEMPLQFAGKVGQHSQAGFSQEELERHMMQELQRMRHIMSGCEDARPGEDQAASHFPNQDNVCAPEWFAGGPGEDEWEGTDIVGLWTQGGADSSDRSESASTDESSTLDKLGEGASSSDRHQAGTSSRSTNWPCSNMPGSSSGTKSDSESGSSVAPHVPRTSLAYALVSQQGEGTSSSETARAYSDWDGTSTAAAADDSQDYEGAEGADAASAGASSSQGAHPRSPGGAEAAGAAGAGVASFQADNSQSENVTPPTTTPEGTDAASRQAMHSKPPRAIPEGIATLVIRNIPARFSSERLVAHWPPRDSYNLLYLPYSSRLARSVGCVFVNFFSPEKARMFAATWHGRKLIPEGRSKPLDIAPAVIEGYSNMLQMFRKQHLGNGLTIKNSSVPLLFDEDGERLDLYSEIAALPKKDESRS